MSPLEKFLGRLKQVRQTGPLDWTTECPAHDDHTPSLHVTAASDGRLLIHCWTGCSFDSVVSAVGMEPYELMPARPRDTPDGPGGSRPLHRPFRTEDLLMAAAHEALIVAMAMESEWRGEDKSLEDEDRVLIAVQRLREFAHRERP